MLLTLLLLPLVSAVSLSNRHDSHDHSIKRQLPGTWFHERDHPVHALFKRGEDSSQPAPVGSPAWAAGFPSPTAAPDSTKLPQEWVDALNAAVAAGVIPNLPQSSGTPDTNPVYPAGHDPSGPEICSATYKCRNPGDFWDAPAGYFGTGFDDGPTASTPALLQFLATNNEKATHFMIGAQIIWFPQQFLQTFHAGEDIAVHTWSHPHMTTLSNLDVLAQLGWTMQLIYASTGGLIPKFWRPPYGDSDNRVRAIAKEVFGLETIIWNQDTEDWSLATGGTTMQAINTSFTQWITGPKSPGLIVLEHEINDQTVAAFTSAYPVLKANGWKTAPVTQLVDGTSAYWNAGSTSGPVSQAKFLDFGANTVTSSITTATVGATQGSQTTTSSSSSSSSSSSPSSSTGSSSSNNSNVKDNSALRSRGLGQGTAWTILILGLSRLLL